MAIKKLKPHAQLYAVEINSQATKILKKSEICNNLWNDSILNFNKKFGRLSFTSGINIVDQVSWIKHINPYMNVVKSIF